MKHCLSKKQPPVCSRTAINKGPSRFRFFFVTTLFLFFSASVVAQQKAITGRVADENNQPVPAVTVAIKGKANSAVTTNSSGVFSINAASGEILVFSSVGYNLVESKVGNDNSLNITLSINSVVGNEVIVVGYGTLQKKDVSGSIVSVKTDTFKSANTSINNVREGCWSEYESVSANGGRLY
jgi:hypothetical protein